MLKFLNRNVFLTDPDLEFWIRVVSRSGSGSGSAGSVAALSGSMVYCMLLFHTAQCC